MADTPTPVPSATPVPEPTATSAPTSTPEPTFEEIYSDDVVAALNAYYAAYNARSQSGLDSAVTASTLARETNPHTIEEMRSTSATVRGWSDYPDIEITEVTHLKCDEVLCKIWFDAISIPPSDSNWDPFDIDMSLFFRRVDGSFLFDGSFETVREEWQSTHRP